VEQDASGQYAVVPDPRRRLPGRGAWLHPIPECLDLAVRRKAFGRALRVQDRLEVHAVRSWVEQVSTPVADTAPVHQHVESGLDAMSTR
jgi:predicted RNA-binding protein YlxR (DUF448 family)